MAESLGNVSLPGAPLIPGVAAAAASPAIELAQQPPPALLLAATLAAVVVGRGGNGALLLRTDYGTLALKTPLSLPPGSRVDLKLLPGPPPAVMLLHIEAPTAQAEPLPAAAPPALGLAPAPAPPGKAASTAPAAAEAPPAQLALGSEVEATLVAPPADGPGPEPVGTRLVLRVVLPVPGAPPAPSSSSASGAAPASFAGTIVAPPPDPAQRTLVATPLGTLSLDKRLALPPGTVLDFTRLATLPPSAPDQLASATVVAARLLSPAPGGTVPTLPAGSRLELRVQALPPPLPGAPASPAPDLTGTVVTSAAGETLIETPIGMLALERRLALPAGTLLSLQRLAAAPPDQPADLPLAQRTTWPSLDEALATLDRTMPELAQRLRNDLSPASGQQLAGTLLFLMSALNNGAWPGTKANAALDGAGRRDLRLKLDGDAAELRQLAAAPSGDWRVYVLPLLDGSVVRPVRFYLRRRSADAASSDQGTRFVLEVEMSRLGALQLDGLARPQRLDLVLRSHRPVAAELRQEIAELFRTVTTASGLAGDISFATASRFAVAPLQAMRTHIGVTA